MFTNRDFNLFKKKGEEMSREIKFRAWDKRKNEFISWEEIKRNTSMNLFGGYFELFNRNEFIPIQYTGLKDKKGKEIYQGDKTKQGWIVVKESGCFWLTSHDSTFKVNYLYMLNKEIEIVGTIHDNKETK